METWISAIPFMWAYLWNHTSTNRHLLLCIGEASERNFSSAGFLSCYPPGSLCKDQKREYLKSDHQTNCSLYYICSNFFDDVIKDPLFDNQFIPWSSESVILGNDDFIHLIFFKKSNVRICNKNIVTKGRVNLLLYQVKK
jgi:hypothetical protein